MKGVKKYGFPAALATAFLLFAACDRQRDLYDTASPLLYIEGDWVPSLGMADMTGKATAMLYKKGDGITKEFFYKPNSVTTKVSRGEYDILLFNGLMFSEENTNLDHIFFRNTDQLEGFEAVVVEVASNRRLSRAEGEYIASNEMEVLTSIHGSAFVEGEHQYSLKYKNGRNSFPTLEDYIEHEVQLTPRAVSYPAQVVVHLINPRSAAIANGSLHGFVGSVMMAPGEPTDFAVTHQLRLNNLTIPDPEAQPEVGTIESPWFVTFGPPLNRPNHSYTLDVSIILQDGNEINETFDIADQVEPAIQRIKNYRASPAGISINLAIPIEITLELPSDIEPGSMVGVNDWSDDEIIVVKIKP